MRGHEFMEQEKKVCNDAIEVFDEVKDAFKRIRALSRAHNDLMDGLERKFNINLDYQLNVMTGLLLNAMRDTAKKLKE